MVDKKFIVALAVILILAAVLLYVMVIQPSVQGYVVGKQLNAQEGTVRAILQIVDQQGFVVVSDENRSVTLVDVDRIQADAPPTLDDQQVQAQQLADETLG